MKLSKAQSEFINKRFGRLIVIDVNFDKIKEEKEKSGKTRIYYNCKCDCGKLTVAEKHALKNEQTTSCGCYKIENTSRIMTTHGATINRNTEKLYSTLCKMKNRCNNINSKDYKYYGERGIKVCSEWEESYESFKNWALNNGYENGLEIDRIDVNGGYNPNNCRWATRKEQMNNTRSNHYLTYNGETKTMMEWSDHLGISYCVIKEAINERGQTLEEFLNKYKPKSFAEYEDDNIKNINGTCYLTYNNETLSSREWSEKLGITKDTIVKRARNGWSAKRIVETPPKIIKKDTII